MYGMGWGEPMEDAVPVHFYTWALTAFSPEDAIDGEIAYDARLFDSLSFFIPLFFLFFFVILRRPHRTRPQES